MLLPTHAQHGDAHLLHDCNTWRDSGEQRDLEWLHV